MFSVQVPYRKRHSVSKTQTNKKLKMFCVVWSRVPQRLYQRK